MQLSTFTKFSLTKPQFIGSHRYWEPQSIFDFIMIWEKLYLHTKSPVVYEPN